MKPCPQTPHVLQGFVPIIFNVIQLKLQDFYSPVQQEDLSAVRADTKAEGRVVREVYNKELSKNLMATTSRLG